MQRILDPAQIEMTGQRQIPRIRLADPDTLFSFRAQRLRAFSATNKNPYLDFTAVLCEAQQAAYRGLRDRMRVLMTQPEGCKSIPAAHPELLGLAREHAMPLLLAAGWPRNDEWLRVLAEISAAIEAVGDFPLPVRRTAARIRGFTPEQSNKLADQLLSARVAEVDMQAAPFVMAALQVYWRWLVSNLTIEAIEEQARLIDVPSVCPVCGMEPLASVVRAEREYQGYRYLHCSLCATEWHMVRIKCTHCLSTAGIQYHTLDKGPKGVRAEACEDCGTYRKIFYQEHAMDLEPVAEDLGSLPLDLLMSDEGFHRTVGNPLFWQQ